MMKYWIIALLALPFIVQSQTAYTISANDKTTQKPLSNISVTHAGKTVGYNGTMVLNANYGDTVFVSHIGYFTDTLVLQKNHELTVNLSRVYKELEAVTIQGVAPVIRKFGIKKKNVLLPFTDGMFTTVDSVEIAQSMQFPLSGAKLHALHLYVSQAITDSATGKINFYPLVDNQPGNPLLSQSISFQLPVQKGWLTIDLEAYNIYLQGKIAAGITLYGDSSGSLPIDYEVKLGGSSKSFYRTDATWNKPPHKYVVHATAWVSPAVKDNWEEDDAKITHVVYSEHVKDSFYLFVRVPKFYKNKSLQTYPVLYLLDGNAYTDEVQTYALQKQKKSSSYLPIIVGIGYRNGYEMDSLRLRDYTYPHIPDIYSSGGADNFYLFLKNELLTFIDSTYQTNGRNSLMGHSFGGYFTLYAMIQSLKDGDAQFQQYVAISPPFDYASGFMVEQLGATTVGNRPSFTSIMSFGSKELSDLTNSQWKEVAHYLQLRQIPSNHFIQDKTNHMGAALPGFEKALQLLQNQ